MHNIWFTDFMDFSSKELFKIISFSKQIECENAFQFLIINIGKKFLSINRISSVLLS